MGTQCPSEVGSLYLMTGGMGKKVTLDYLHGGMDLTGTPPPDILKIKEQSGRNDFNKAISRPAYS